MKVIRDGRAPPFVASHELCPSRCSSPPGQRRMFMCHCEFICHCERSAATSPVHRGCVATLTGKLGGGYGGRAMTFPSTRVGRQPVRNSQ